MAVTKLRADAPPFTISHCRLHFPPPPPPHCMAVPVCNPHPATCPPPFSVVPSYPFAPILPPPPRPIYGFPPLPHPPAPVPFFGKVVPPPPRRNARVAFPFLRKRKVVHMPPPTLPAGTGAFLHKADPSPPPAAPLGSKDVPSPPPPTKPALLRRGTLPFGSPPHKLMLLLGGGVVAEKQQAREAAMARAAEPVNPGQEPAPAPAAGPRHGMQMASPRLLRRQQQAAERGRSGKEVGRPPVERACRRASRSQSPAFTTRPASPIPAPEWRKRQVTTVMIRNIPNKLKPEEMMQLLDEHCACANSRKKKKKPVLAAYDFLYLPMDFRKHGNMGYAFVNLTTAAAARGLHYGLHGARWTVHGTRKVVDIRAARIQGKDALVTHFSGSTFQCHTDDYLPAAFSPPRDGAAGPSSAARRVGNRVNARPPPPPAAPQPLPVAPAPAPPQQAWRPVARVVQEAS